jgi:RNA polymerase sigma-70 factor (ECF subfamily)
MLPVAGVSGDAHTQIAHLYERHYQPLLRMLTRLAPDRETAEDLCHETFIKALCRWAQHDPQSNAVAWLYRIATNVAYDHLRKRRIRTLPLPAHEAVECEDTQIERVLLAEPLREALVQLPLHYRTLLVQYANEGHNMREIAAASGCSVNAVKTRLCRARRRFREVYEASAEN